MPTLLVACHPDQLTLVSSLKSDRYQLMLKTSGKDALAYLREHTPDLMVLDVALPEVSGLDICYRTKKISRLKQVPVLLLVSDRDQQRQQLEAKLARADRVLPHGTNRKELGEMVQELLADASAAPAKATPQEASQEAAEETPGAAADAIPGDAIISEATGDNQPLDLRGGHASA